MREKCKCGKESCWSISSTGYLDWDGESTYGTISTIYLCDECFMKKIEELGSNE